MAAADPVAPATNARPPVATATDAVDERVTTLAAARVQAELSHLTRLGIWAGG